MVGAEESHQLWHLDDLNESGLVNIEVSPGLGEVGVEVGLEGSTAESLMGAENFGGSGSHSGLVHDEFAAWNWVLVFTGAVLVDGVVLDH